MGGGGIKEGLEVKLGTRKRYRTFLTYILDYVISVETTSQIMVTFRNGNKVRGMRSNFSLTTQINFCVAI